MTGRGRTLRAMALTLAATLVAVQAGTSARNDPVVGTEARDRSALEGTLDLADEAAPLVGFAGPSFPDEEPIPTGRTDRTQQWFAGGRWWAVLLDAESGDFHIWALSGPGGTWLDTGVLVEERADAQPDVVWTGTSLLVVTAGTRSYRSHAARIARFSFDGSTGRWTPDPDFPIAITDEGVHGASLSVTDDGTVWATYLEDDGLRVTYSDTGGQVWADSFDPGDGTTPPASEFSTTVHEGDLTVGWRTPDDSALHLARHVGEPEGGSWTTTTYAAAGLDGGGDLVVRDGRPVGLEGILAVAERRTDETTGSLEPAISLYHLLPDGGIAEHLVARVADDLAQPRMVLDPEGRQVVVLATSTNEAGTIRTTRAPAETLSFDLGNGAPAIRLPGAGPVANPIVSDPPGDTAAGVLVMAAAGPARRYVAAVMPVSGPVDLRSSDTVATIESATLVHDSFETRPLGSPAPTNWYYRGSPGGGSVTVATGRDTRAVSLMVDAEGSGHERCRDFPPVRDQPITIEAIVQVEGGGGTDARLLTVRGSTGVLSSARLSQRGDVGWLTENGRSRGLRVGPGTPLRVVTRLDPTTKTYRMSISVLSSGDTVLEVADTPWLAGDAEAIEAICVTPPDGPTGSAILIDDLTISEDGQQGS